MCPDKILLSRFYDGDLNVSQSREIEFHLSGCSGCSHYIGELKNQSLMLNRLDVPVSVNLEEKIRDRVLHSRTYWTRHYDFIIPLPLAAVASILILLLAGFVIIRPAAAGKGKNSSFRLVTGHESGAAETQKNVDDLLASMKEAGFFDEVEMEIPLEMGEGSYNSPELVKLASVDGGN